MGRRHINKTFKNDSQEDKMAGIDFYWHLAARIRYELITEEVKEEDE